MRTATKHTGENYYESILCYEDYLLFISNDPNKPMNDIQFNLKFKNDNGGNARTLFWRKIEEERPWWKVGLENV